MSWVWAAYKDHRSTPPTFIQGCSFATMYFFVFFHFVHSARPEVVGGWLNDGGWGSADGCQGLTDDS